MMRNKYLAALIAFFGGAFGLHKFYLGQNGAGILYLLFCWTWIPGIVAFFEGIGLLFMPDEAFDAKFNRGISSTTRTIFSIPATSNSESTKDKIATLAELKKLYDAGIITAEEFEQKRRKILNSI